jgi:hypothetical protein
MNWTDNGNNYRHKYYLVFRVLRSVFTKSAVFYINMAMPVKISAFVSWRFVGKNCTKRRCLVSKWTVMYAVFLVPVRWLVFLLLYLCITHWSFEETVWRFPWLGTVPIHNAWAKTTGLLNTQVGQGEDCNADWFTGMSHCRFLLCIF